MIKTKTDKKQRKLAVISVFVMIALSLNTTAGMSPQAHAAIVPGTGDARAQDNSQGIIEEAPIDEIEANAKATKDTEEAERATIIASVFITLVIVFVATLGVMYLKRKKKKSTRKK